MTSRVYINYSVTTCVSGPETSDNNSISRTHGSGSWCNAENSCYDTSAFLKSQFLHWYHNRNHWTVSTQTGISTGLLFYSYSSFGNDYPKTFAAGCWSRFIYIQASRPSSQSTNSIKALLLTTENLPLTHCFTKTSTDFSRKATTQLVTCKAAALPLPISTDPIYNNITEYSAATVQHRLNTYSPASISFDFSSFFSFGRPIFIFRGLVGVLPPLADDGSPVVMKWANNSVCLRRKSNRLERSVCFIAKQAHRKHFSNYKQRCWKVSNTWRLSVHHRWHTDHRHSLRVVN